MPPDTVNSGGGGFIPRSSFRDSPRDAVIPLEAAVLRLIV